MKKKFNYFLAILATIMFSGVYAQQTVKITPSGIGYLEYLPQGYNSNSNKYPVVISLHGIKERGTSSTDPAIVKAGVMTVANVGLPKYVRLGTNYPFILISPQLKNSYGSWPSGYVMEVINYVKTKLRIDESRIYLTGLSLGGFGVWRTAGDYPGVFAAIAPVCSGGNSLSKACAIASENVATWAFHGDKDGTVSYQVSLKMVNAINACTPKPSPLAKITIYPGLGHVIWDKVYKESSVLNWMLTFKNGTTTSTPLPTNLAPIANAGSDKTVILPTNSVSLAGSGSDPDGTISTYQWVKVTGGTASLSGTTTPTLKAASLATGSYAFRLTVKDNKGATKSDDVLVTVKSSTTTNIVPVVSAGPDKGITLPYNQASIQGSASDPDGTIASYQWTKVSGGSAVLNNATKSKLDASGMTAGTYVFRLTVKDNKGSSKYDDMKVTVKTPTTAK